METNDGRMDCCYHDPRAKPNKLRRYSLLGLTVFQARNIGCEDEHHNLLEEPFVAASMLSLAFLLLVQKARWQAAIVMRDINDNIYEQDTLFRIAYGQSLYRARSDGLSRRNLRPIFEATVIPIEVPGIAPEIAS
jgi:hypothetical protein